MVHRTDCKYFRNVTRYREGIDGNKDPIKDIECQIGKMSAGGCLENCPWFESK